MDILFCFIIFFQICIPEKKEEQPKLCIPEKKEEQPITSSKDIGKGYSRREKKQYGVEVGRHFFPPATTQSQL